jgi:hypothetical protein
MTIYFYAALLYLILVETIRRLWNRLERPPHEHLRRDATSAEPVRTADLVPATR